MSSSSRSWLRWVAYSSISLSLQVLLSSDFLMPQLWKQWTTVPVDTSFQATCSQWIAFAMLTSCIIFDAFLPSSIRDTTYFISSFPYLHFNATIKPASSGCKQDVVHLGRKSTSCLSSYFENFRVARCVIKKEDDLFNF